VAAVQHLELFVTPAEADNELELPLAAGSSATPRQSSSAAGATRVLPDSLGSLLHLFSFGLLRRTAPREAHDGGAQLPRSAPSSGSDAGTEVLDAPPPHFKAEGHATGADSRRRGDAVASEQLLTPMQQGKLASAG
jgi:hypothetical protein